MTVRRQNNTNILQMAQMHCGDGKDETEWPGSKTHEMINQTMTKPTEKNYSLKKKLNITKQSN